MGLAELVDLLKSGGPYTLAAISMFVAVKMYKGREEDRKEHATALTAKDTAAAKQLEDFREASREEHEEKNNKLFTLAERMATVIATTDTNQTQLTKVVEQLLTEVREMRR